MSALLKAGFAVALASIAVDGDAKTNDKCIRMLEARPEAREIASVRPCPMAARFDAWRHGPAGSAGTGSSARDLSQPLPLADAATDTRSPDPAGRVRRV